MCLDKGNVLLDFDVDEFEKLKKEQLNVQTWMKLQPHGVVLNELMLSINVILSNHTSPNPMTGSGKDQHIMYTPRPGGSYREREWRPRISKI